MRRAILVFALGVCAFAVAALAGFYAASRVAPDRLRAEAEARLSQALRAPVRLGSVRVSLTEQLPWVHLEALEARVDPLPGGSSLAVHRVTARIDPFLLALGRLELRGLRLEGVALEIPIDVAQGRGPPPADWPSAAVARLSALADQLRSRPCPLPDIDVTSISVALTSAAAPRVLVQDAQGHFTCARLSATGRLEVRGRIQLGAGAEAPLSLTARVDDAELEAHVSLDSTPLAGAARALGLEPGFRGTIAGDFTWRSRPRAPQELVVAARGRGWQGRLGEGVEAWRLDLPSPNASLTLEAGPTEIRARDIQVSDGTLAFSGEAALGIPLGDAQTIRLAAQVAPTDRAALVHLAKQLPAGIGGDLSRFLDRVQGGRVKRLGVTLASDQAGARAVLGGGLLERSGALKFDLALEEVDVLVGQVDRLQDVTGTLSFDGDTAYVHALGARFRERRLPRLAVKLTGIANLHAAEEVRCDRPAPAPKLLGIDEVRAWIESRRRPPYRRSWNVLELEVARLSHPALLCTLEDGVGKLTRTDGGGSDFTVERGVWAGLPISASGSYRKAQSRDGRPSADGGSITLDIALAGRPIARAPEPAPEGEWARGHFAFDVDSLSRWLVGGYSGDFRMQGSDLVVASSVLPLRPSGELEGGGTLHLGESGPPRFEVQAQAKGLDLIDLFRAAQLDKQIMAGTLTGAAVISGALRLGQSPLAGVDGYASLHARKGEIYRNVPFLLALAMTDEKVNPFGKRDQLPYKAIDLDGAIEDGWLESRTLTLEGKSERMAASGKTHLADPYELEGVIGMYTIPTIDSILQQIPIINYFILGEDKALAGFYFSVTGEWTNPTVTPLVGKSFASGPASIVLEGVPNFVFGSLRAIASVLTPPAPAAPAAPEAPQ